MNRFWVLVRKELLEIVGDRNSRQGGLVQGAVFIALLGVFVPGANTHYWVEDSPATPLFYAFLPGIVAASIAADAFAGERERQTLETLLATPLTEAMILYGKAFAAIAYGVAVAACGVAVSIVSINVGAWPYVPSLAMRIGGHRSRARLVAGHGVGGHPRVDDHSGSALGPSDLLGRFGGHPFGWSRCVERARAHGDLAEYRFRRGMHRAHRAHRVRCRPNALPQRALLRGQLDLRTA